MFDRVTVIDGGLSNQLEAQGQDLSGALWSARLLRDAPEQVVAAHRAYVDAGAQVIITASYQASFDGFARAGIEASEAESLMRRSVTCAREAADGRALVAASVGPYGATLADGSEYRGRYGLDREQLRAWHERRLEVLVDAGPDLLAIETIPDIDEAEAIIDLIRGSRVRAWLSYTVAGARTRAGQPLGEAYALVADVPEVVATGANCSAPTDMLNVVQQVAATTSKPAVVYPNSGEGWDADARAWTGTGTSIAELAPSWVDAGARVVGGCCRVGPDQIAVLAHEVAR